MTGLIDSWQRQINYLRISVTDHCNLNCVYCSVSSLPHLPRNEILTYEEIQRLVQVAASMGITKVRLTGGEPLLRSDLSQLVTMLAQIEGIDDISLTSNGILLSRYAVELKEAGLKRVNVSLDTLKEDRFKQIINSFPQIVSYHDFRVVAGTRERIIIVADIDLKEEIAEESFNQISENLGIQVKKELKNVLYCNFYITPKFSY